MKVLLIAELHNGILDLNMTARAVGAATHLGEITVLLAGRELDAAAQTIATIDGVHKVICVENDAYKHNLPEPMADLICDLAEEYAAIVASAASNGKNILPRVAALLDVMHISDVTNIIDIETFERTIYAGNAIQTVKSTDTKKVLTIRCSAFDAPAHNNNAEIETLTDGQEHHQSRWLGDEVSQSGRPDLSSAHVIISGGRGVGSAEGFSMLNDLADKLGGAVGASRAAVDAGYVPNDLQIGQTGKIVAPDLYIAVGISGAIQHLAGIKSAKTIIAINKDPEAPIFQFADYGLVADLFEVMPTLNARL